MDYVTKLEEYSTFKRHLHIHLSKTFTLYAEKGIISELVQLTVSEVTSGTFTGFTTPSLQVSYNLFFITGKIKIILYKFRVS